MNVTDLTTIVGKNDVGKSTILEALEIFFNNDTVSIDQQDACVFGEGKFVEISCEFSAFPAIITLDAGAETSLADEYLLTSSGRLKIKKVYDCNKKNPTCEVFILAHHPTAEGFANLLDLKQRELQAIIKDRCIASPLKKNPLMRKSIWASCSDLDLAETALSVTKLKEDSKRIWDQLESYLPLFALFQSDRSSRDSDSEVQDPMRAAVTTALAEVQDQIVEIQAKVKEKAEQIAINTLNALHSIDANLARELNPQFAPPSAAKWVSLFSVGLDTENGIPLNKRGSGIRRVLSALVPLADLAAAGWLA